jgi:acetyl-CoA C-acetyltransferase
MNPARQVALKSGLPVEVPAVTVNRVCASGLQAVVSAAQAIKAGDAELIIAGGMENMNQAPYYLKKARYGYRMAMYKDELVDGMVYDGLWDVLDDCHMGITAENIAEKYQLSRKEQDEFALRSHVKARAAIESDYFGDQIVPIEVSLGKGRPILFDTDEGVRFDTSLEKLTKLPAAFKEDGTVTAGNSSGISDGAAAMVVATEKKAKSLGLEVYGKVKSYVLVGVEPAFMGLAPVPAINEALSSAGLTLDDIDLFEINEAFSAQCLGVLRELPVPQGKLNVNGGAIALGHPIGATGAILLVKILHEMRRRDVSLGLVSLCVGGGMGMALIVESG